MANKKHSGQRLTDSGLGTWASYKTAWIIRQKKNSIGEMMKNIITLVMESFLANF